MSDETVVDNGRPSACGKEFRDLGTSVHVGVPVQTDVDVRPLVEYLDELFEEREDALQETKEDRVGSAVAADAIDQLVSHVEDTDEETAKADGPERC